MRSAKAMEKPSTWPQKYLRARVVLQEMQMRRQLAVEK